jgi:hypothetical protein
VDEADAVTVGIGHAADVGRAPVDVDGAGIGDMDPAEHLDESGLAGPLLAQQGVDLARPEIEIHMVQSRRAAEALRDAAQAQHGHFG